MAISDTITSMYANTSNAYDMLSNGTDLTGINKNLENLSSTIFEAFLEALRNPDTLFTNLPKTSGSGSQITLNGTAYAPMRITLNPTAISQTTYTGKNKLAYTLTQLQTINTLGTWNNNIYTFNGVIYTINGDLTISTSGSASSTSYLYINSSLSLDTDTNYILNGSPTGGAYNKYSIRIYTGTQYVSDVGAGKDFTFGSQDAIRINFYTGTSATGLIFSPMVRLASVSDSTYEPYVGGIASPNSSYPQDIHTISGNNSVVVEGKNLCYKIEKQNNTNIRFYFTNKSIQKYINVSFTINESLTNNSLYLVVDGESYGIAGQITGSANTRVNVNITFSDTNLEIIKNGTTCYLQLYKSGATFDLPTQAQIENGTSMTSYTPYVSQTTPINLGSNEFCKIGDYSDEFYLATDSDTELESGKWYIKKIINKVVLDGTESWILNESGTDYVRFTTTESNLILNFVNTKKYAISDKFLSSTQFETVNANADANRVCVVTNSRLLFKTLDISLSTAELWKTWLTSNNVIVYYVMATPTYTKITGELAQELEQVYKGMLSYDGTTNISQVNNDLAFELVGSAITK